MATCTVFMVPVITGLLLGVGGGATAIAKVTLFRDSLHPAFLLVYLSSLLLHGDMVTVSPWLAWNLFKLSWPQTRKFCFPSIGIRGVRQREFWVLRTFSPFYFVDECVCVFITAFPAPLSHPTLPNTSHSHLHVFLKNTYLVQLVPLCSVDLVA